MNTNRYRAYLCTGRLYDGAAWELMPQAADALLLWVRNGHYYDADLGVCLEIGSSDDHGGLIHFSDSRRFVFTDTLLTHCSTSVEGYGSIATPESPQSDEREDFVPYSVSLSRVDVGDKTGAQLEIAPNASDGGGLVELTATQRRDLANFLKAGKPLEQMHYDVTDLVFPDGHTETVDTYHLYDDPDSFIDI